MSLLTNEELVADLGWGMQIIHDSTGGRVPRYWRPPYGDADNRVRAIAKEIFGLTTVVWNNDSEDWTMASGGTNLPAVQQAFTNWYNGPRSPGLIILEHEITADDVTAFMNMYPLIAAAQGGAPWVVSSLAGLFDGHSTGWNGNSWYQNSDNDTSPVNDSDILVSNTTSTTAASTQTGTASHTATAIARNGAEKNLGSIRGAWVVVTVLAGVLSLVL
jgi:chitin deacetylase